MRATMQIVALPAIVLLLSMSAPCCQAAAVTPVEKVLEMLYAMAKKGEAAMKEEEKIYIDYMRTTKAMSKGLSMDIEAAKDDKEELEALIINTDDIIADLAKSIAGLQDELKETTDVKAKKIAEREKQAAENMKLRVDAQESVDALKRAIQSLGSRNQDYEQAYSPKYDLLQKMADSDPALSSALSGLNLLQFNSTFRRSEPRKIIFEPPEELEPEVNAPKADAYEFQSDAILDLLKKLHEKFSSELEEVMATETKQARASELEVQHLTNTIDSMNADLQRDLTMKGEKAAESAQAKSKLATVEKDLAADEKTFSDLKATFSLKTDAYRENQKVRAGELQAIREATDIVASVKVNRNYKKNIYLTQEPATLIQISSAQSRIMSHQKQLTKRVAALLHQRAKALSSRMLYDLAQKAGSPFGKVIEMIENMLMKLKEDAEAEAAHKEWCDKQLAKNEAKRTKFETEIAQLEASIDTKTGTIDEQKKQIKRLSDEVSQLLKDMAAITAARAKEKAENKKTIADAEVGIAATKEALKILNDFYAGQSFMQVKQAPEMAEYKGMMADKGGIVGMLEVIQTDFTRLFTDTSAAEKAAVDEYKSNMDDMYSSQSEKDEELHALKLANDRLDFARKQDKKSLKMVSKDYKNTMEVYETLKSSCIEVKVSYQERAQQREEEIAALREAYDLLNSKGEDGGEGTVTIEPPGFGEGTVTIEPPGLGEGETSGLKPAQTSGLKPEQTSGLKPEQTSGLKPAQL